MIPRLAAVLSVGLALPLLAQTHAVSPAVQAQITPLFDEQMQAANAHDTDRFLKTYLHSPELVFVENGEIIRGWDALRVQQLKWWQNGNAKGTYQVTAPADFVGVGRDAVIMTEPISAHRIQPDGSAKDGNAVLTMLWRKAAEGWRVTYAHESWAR